VPSDIHALPKTRSELNRAATPLLFAVGAALSAAGGVAIALQPFAICLAVALLFLLIRWQLRRLPTVWAASIVGWGSCALCLAIAWGLGHGVHSLDLGYPMLVVAVVALLAGLRAGLLLALACAAAAGAMAWAEVAGVLPGRASLASMPLSHSLVTQWLLLAASLTVGAVLARVADRAFMWASENERRFRSVLSASVDVYWELDALGHCTMVEAMGPQAPSASVLSARIGRLAWYAVEGLSVDESQSLRVAIEGGQPFKLVVQRLDPMAGDGASGPGSRLVVIRGEPRHDDQGRRVGHWGVERDVTDEVRAEQALAASESARNAADKALRRSQTLLVHLFNTSPDAVTLSETATGRYLMVNASFTRQIGFREDEMIGRTSLELGLWPQPQEREAMLAAIGQQGQVEGLAVTLRRRSGEPLRLVVSVANFMLEGQSYLVMSGRDVTESEQRRLEYEAILHNASIGIALTRDRQFVQANPRCEQMLGWAPGSLAGQPGRVVWGSEDAYRQVGALLGPRLAAGEGVETECELVRRDGSRFLCRIQAQAVDPTHPSRGGTIWLLEDVTEQRQVQQALALARDQAEAASRAKSAFLANTSHELRTPLNGLLGLARLAQEPALDEGLRQRYLSQILDSARNLAAIISDILDLSKIEAGKLDLEPAPFWLRETVASACQAHEALAQQRGLAFHWSVDERLPQAVRGDAMRVRQILANFLSNALKFTEQGSVVVEVRPAEGSLVRLSVTDTGPGIDAATQGRLFRPFSQGDESTTRRYGGTGLGLSICRELAARMGGAVGLDSTPGRGSCFWAELPLPASAPPRQDTPAAAATLASLRGARVLLAEDNAVNRMIVMAMLAPHGVEVVEAHDGSQAVEAAWAAHQAGHPFDAVLMDLQMPVMGGYEAAERLRERFDARTLPIVAFTAAALVSERDEAAAAGMNAFLTKPVDAQDLQQTLHRVLAARGPQRGA
jgi:PAS domain S-box-containing protein